MHVSETALSDPLAGAVEPPARQARASPAQLLACALACALLAALLAASLGTPALHPS